MSAPKKLPAWMTDETVPMLHIPDDWEVFASIRNYMFSVRSLDMSARDVSAGIMATLRGMSRARAAAPIVAALDQPEPDPTAALDQPEPEPTAAGDRLEAAYNDALYAIQALYESYAKVMK